ncbi:MOSC domain-containing protein [Halosimplex sp. TS25]|uniref:MOSC domain-containing protein n=1 Tax=Halosimplex rarum TaxID=3396619 RepID=UPI0039EB5B1D
MARLERLRVFPVKGLDGIDLEATEILEGGTLRHDREYALFDTDGEVLNGKRTDRVHDLATDFDPVSGELAVETPDGEEREFDLDAERERAAEWFGDFFDADLELHRDDSLGYVDRREMGPSVVSTATLEAVASWFEEMTVEGARRRLRANVEISGVPAFWEDRFVGDGAPAFDVDGVRFEGITPCGRCVVPQRDPGTGEPTPEFRERFVERREATFPEWADWDAFDHYYTLMVITRIPEADRGATLAVDDEVDVVE